MKIDEYLQSMKLPLLIPAKQAGELIGIKPGTTKNLISENKFPIEVRKSGRAYFVRIDDLSIYLDELFDRRTEQEPSIEQKSGPGRRRKVAA